jgi:hypothetical protein
MAADDPLTWLLILERGRQTADFALAARAQKELERIGVRVTYLPPIVPKPQESEEVSVAR